MTQLESILLPTTNGTSIKTNNSNNTNNSSIKMKKTTPTTTTTTPTSSAPEHTYMNGDEMQINLSLIQPINNTITCNNMNGTVNTTTTINEYDSDLLMNSCLTTTSAPNTNTDICDNIKNKSMNSFKNGKQNSMAEDDVKVQVYYCGLIMVVYIKEGMKLDDFINLLRIICKFDGDQLFTIKWVDEEGDPCTMSSQNELDEAIRLYYINKESELVIHLFANIPERPGTQCTGEDRSIYRRGARRWRKLYLVNGHKYQAKRYFLIIVLGCEMQWTYI
jgi:hypothetical protein